MSIRMLRGLAFGLLAVAVAACGASRSRPGTQQERTVLAVDNRAFNDMTVYVVEGAGARRRLGLATGLSTTTFTVPASLVGLGRELSFIVDPIGGNRTSVSNSLYVLPGQRVTLTIPPG